MRGMPVLYQLLRQGQLGTLDDLAESSLNVRQAESKARGIGHVLVSVDPAGAMGAYVATITTPEARVTMAFDPDSAPYRLLQEAGVSKIPPRGAVSRYIPLDIAVMLVNIADGRTA